MVKMIDENCEWEAFLQWVAQLQCQLWPQSHILCLLMFFFSFSINVFLMSHWNYKLERYTLTNLHCTVIVHGWIQAFFPEEQFGKSYFALERLCCIYRIIGSICSWGLWDCLHEAKDGERFTGIKALVHQEQLKIHSLRFARWFQAKVKLKLQRTTWSLGLLIILMNTALSCPTFAYSWVFFLP